MSRNDVYFEILSLMDKALIRGANHFTPENAAALRDEKVRWIEMGGSSEDVKIIDRFLTTTNMARGAPDEQVQKLTDQTTELKSAWRSIGAPE